MYDTRIARFWGVDPLTKDYPMLTPFQFASCSPILLVDVDGLEGIENTVGYMSNGVPFSYFNARQSTYVKPKTLPEVELKKTIFQQSTKQKIPYQGEIRPAPSEYEIAWAESAGYFGPYIYLDPIVRATATGGFVFTTGSFGTYVWSNTLPYVVRGGVQLYSLGWNAYNNPWGKRAIGIGLGIIANEQKWSPDINFSDPLINVYNQSTQFFLYSVEKINPFFQMNPKVNTDIVLPKTNSNDKPNQTQSTEKENQTSR